jgi:hypothetical protein
VSFIQSRPVATHDFYGPVHKGLRLAQTQMLVRLGACGGDDAAELATLLGDLIHLLHVAEHHLENEDRWVHTALEARAPGSTVRLAQDHEHHRQTFEELEVLIAEADVADLTQRARAMRQLYLRFSRFMADDFAHMAEEEQLILPILQSLFTDAELERIEDQILSGISPEALVSFGRLMIPAATRADRIALLSAIRANAPAEGFAAILKFAAQPTLSYADYTHLRAGLGMEAPEPPLRQADETLHWGRVPV